MSPPWHLRESTDTNAVFVVDYVGASLISGDAGVPGKYTLEVGVESGAARARADRDARQALARSEEMVRPVAAVETDTGDRGFELVSREAAGAMRFHRQVYLTHPRGVVHLSFQSLRDLALPEVDVMVRHAEVMPE